MFTIYDKLRASYDGSLGFWTKEQLNFDKYSYFPNPLPDSFIRLTPEGPRPRDRQFFLSYLDDETPFFVHVRRIQRYIDYIESGEWDATDKKVRGVLLVCESSSLLKRVRKN